MHNEDQLDVMIVEDDPLISIFIKKTVQMLGENVVGVCYNSNDAIHMLKTKRPHLIFMDINIEGPLDGISVIRSVPLPYNPSIYFVSAYNDTDTISDALSTNPYNYIIKPIKEQDIEIAVKLAKKHQKMRVAPQKERVTFNENVYYDLEYKEIYIDNHPVPLSRIEKKLLDMFVQKINYTLNMEEIRSNIWMDKNVSDTTIRDKICTLRKKIPQLDLQTKFGRGYTLLK